MNLPGADRAFVDPGKLRDYLLSFAHKAGQSKAGAFAAAGYSALNWQRLADQLRMLASSGAARPAGDVGYGPKYLVDGILRTPAGKSLRVRTVWIVRHGEDFPRLVTAYPGRRL